MSSSEILLLTCLLAPLSGAGILLIAGRSLPKSFASALATTSVFLSFIAAFLLFRQTGAETAAFKLNLFSWFTAGKLSVDMAFRYDQLTALFLLVITGIGSLIHLYSAGYMHEDEGHNRFFGYLNFFVFFMIILVTGANFAVMFAGWEGVGLCSYLLIGFWYKNSDYNLAARKAFVMNRIGDLGLLAGLFMLLNRYNTLDFEALQEAVKAVKSGDAYLTTATVCLFIGAMGKSAQLPLFTWLPDAMAGPTPVSALIHAATMVTAGIYLVVRNHFLFSLTPATLDLILYVGLATALFAATIGLRQNDIKKVLAYSTVSQLGFMFIALGTGAFTTGFFHVFTHAFFKALLFLGAGSVIHALHHEQDMRFMGGLKKKLPITWITFLIGTTAISGIPPLAGFFSKDEILAFLYAKNPILWGLALLGSLMTAFYMFRLYFLVFHGSYRGDAHTESHIHESPISMTLPLMVLAACSLIAGFIGIPEVFAAHSHWLNHFLGNLIPVQHPEGISHSTEITLMGISVTAVLVMVAIAFRVYGQGKVVPVAPEEEKNPVFKLLAQKYRIDELYNFLFVAPFNAISQFFGKIVDNQIVDGIVNAMGNLAMTTSGLLRLLHNGRVGTYLLAMTLGVILVLAYNLIF